MAVAVAGNVIKAADFADTAAAELATYQPVFVLKTATQDTISNTAHVDDAELTIALDADCYYELDFSLFMTGAAAADAKILLGLTNCAALSLRTVVAPAVSSTATNDTNAYLIAKAYNASTIVGTDGTNVSSVSDKILVETVTSGDAGTVVVKWAQNASTASNTSVLAGSWLKATKLIPA